MCFSCAVTVISQSFSLHRDNGASDQVPHTELHTLHLVGSEQEQTQESVKQAVG